MHSVYYANTAYYNLLYSGFSNHILIKFNEQLLNKGNV